MKRLSCHGRVVNCRRNKSFGYNVLEVRPHKICGDPILLRKKHVFIFSVLSFDREGKVACDVIVRHDGVGGGVGIDTLNELLKRLPTISDSYPEGAAVSCRGTCWVGGRMVTK